MVVRAASYHLIATGSMAGAAAPRGKGSGLVSETSPLDRLAEHYGIVPAYTDNWGRRREVSDATRRALLAAMGVPVASDGELRSSLERLEAEAWGEVLPPVAVLRAGAPLATVVSLPAPASGRLAWAVATEDGERREGALVLDELEVLGRRPIDGRERQRLRLPLPLELPPGYHRLEVSAGAGPPAAMTLIVTPERACGPAETGAGERSWGVTAPLYGLRSAQSWGIGDCADLGQLAQAMAGLGAALIGINPVHALFPALSERISPYSPSSRRFLNVLMISIEQALRQDWARDLAPALAACRAELLGLQAAPLVDYPAVAALKLGALERLYEAFARRGPDSAAAALRDFEARTGPSLARHALFEALLEHFAGPDRARASWRSWPEGFRSPDGAGAAAFAREHAPRIRFYKFLQWLADEQLGAAQAAARAAGMPIGLYLDLAVGVDPDGADAWAEQGVVAGGVRIGAPPDDFSPKGQDWGLAPLAPHALRAAAYGPFIELLRQNMRHAGALRIDHVLGLRRSYWLPPERELEGAYVRYPLADLLGLIALESRRHGCIVIGEDLGTVPEDFRAPLAEAGLLGCRVLYFEQDEGGRFRPAPGYPQGCLASISTHDLPTLRGFWVGRDIDWRERLGLFADPDQPARERAERVRLRQRLLLLLAAEGLLAPELDADEPPAELPWSVVLALHRLLARSPAQIVALQLEDALGAVEQANLPGTTGEHPNWRRRLEVALEELAAEPRLRALAAALTAERRRIDLDASGAIGDN
jgi:4-alpha-glucanotransferase